MEARPKVEKSPLWAVFSGRLVKMRASEGPPRAALTTGGFFLEILPRGPDRGASPVFRVVDPRHCRAHAIAHVIRKVRDQWSDGASTMWCLYRRFSTSVCSGLLAAACATAVAESCLVITLFAVTAEASAPQFLRFPDLDHDEQMFAGVLTSLNVEIWSVRGAVDRAGTCGSHVMEKCRDDPVCTVSCRCLTESRDCQADGARAREAPFRNSIVDLLVPPIQEHAVEAFRVFTEEYVLSACRAVYVLSCRADFERDRVAGLSLQPVQR